MHWRSTEKITSRNCSQIGNTSTQLHTRVVGVYILYTKFVEKLSDCEDLYEFLRPTNKKVINLLSGNPKTSAESTSLGYLQKYIRMLRNEDIKTFLRFCTGADVLYVKQIKVSFSKLDGIERRLVAHTCWPLLEVPITYEDFGQFKGELHKTLQSGYWNMDIV